uniref:Calcium voltage-gated channel auxiliary subunit alpha2delta 4 n=1 Tax=Propithecus coquereli TaxID=379532 RepID=A0A2K6EYQ3_PROCO
MLWGSSGLSLRGGGSTMPGRPSFQPNPSCTHSGDPWPQRLVAWSPLRKAAAVLWLLLLGTSLSPTRGQPKIPLEIVKLWADTFGGDLYTTVTKYSGSLLLQKKYKDVEPSLKIKEVDGLELVRKFSEDMESMLRRKVEAVQSLVEAAEEADLNHEYNASLVFDYYNSVLINERDAKGRSVELGAELVLEANAHFSNLRVNTSVSSVQLPTNVYNKDPDILNGVYMSEALNPVFVENFQRDPTLTWQYFGSSTGFFRIYPGILVQADRDNREHFKQLVDELMVKGVGVVNPALSEAFEILQQFQEARQGSLCNQAIMLITDGAVEDYEPVFKKYNWPDRKISTLADAQENVMEYLHVLSRPMVINHDHDITWTEAYMDSKLFTSQAQSLTLLTTVAMPVFSKKNETRSHGILLGVVGSDVTLRELMKLAPRYKLGVHGYAFLNTNNGYLLSHPDLRPLYREGKKLKPKPNYNSVDLSEVEWEDRAETKRVLFLTNDYFFTDISDTPFSLGVALSRGHGEYILLGNTSVEEGLHDLLHPDLSLASDWIYCVTDIDPDHRKLSQLEAMVRFLTREDPDLECDEELVREVLFDAVVTAPMEAYWTALALNVSNETEPAVDRAFLGTRAGLLRSGLFVGSEKLSDRKFLTPADEASVFTLDRFPLWYRQASEQPAGSFVFNLRFAEGPESPGEPAVVTASTAVAVTVDKKTAIAAAVGVQMKLEFLRRKFWAATRQCGAAAGPCPKTCEDSDLDCFVIDNNGFILISERAHEPGVKLKEKPVHTW